MRLRSLRLERYGPFTGQVLTFRADAKLYIVTGPNEAGKSCALAAITDLLFGIRAQTSYDFLHAGKDLRIGAEIEGRDGSHLSFRRRKGNRNTLVDANDVALAEDALTPYLGGLTRDVFSRAFGLDAQSLREGAREMLRSEGEVGATLFAAASGMRGLSELRRALEVDAENIFAPRAAKDRRFYQALNDYEDARRAIRDNEVRAGDWKDLNKRIADATARLDAIKALRASKIAERSKLERLKRVAPMVRSIDRTLSELEAFSSLPAVSADFAERLRSALNGVEVTEAARAKAEADRTKATCEFSDVIVDEPLLAAANDILVLFSEMKAYTDSRRDLPRVESEADDFRAVLAGLATRLGLADAKEVEARQPSDPAIAAVRAMIAEGQEIRDDLSRHARSLADERVSLEAVKRERAAAAVGIYPAPLQEKFATLRPALALLERRDEKDRAVRGEARAVVEAAARLNPPVAELDALAKRPLPAPDTIARFRRTLDALEKDIERVRDSQRRALDACAAIEQRLRKLSSAGAIPSAESVAEARARRDGEWGPLKSALLDPASEPSGAALTSGVAAFERHLAEADRLADAAAAEAGRVAAHAADTSQLAAEQRLVVDATETLSGLLTRQSQTVEEWNNAWTGAGITPLPPTEMAVWFADVTALIARRDRLEALRDDLTATNNRIAEIEPPLRTLAAEAGIADIAGVAADLVAARIEDRLRKLSEDWDRVRNLDTRIADAEMRIHRLSEAYIVADTRYNQWRTNWASGVAPIGLPPDASIEQADAALAAWQEVAPAVRERDNRTKRVVGMQRNLDDFERRAKLLADELAPDLAALSADAVAKALSDRLAAAKTAETRRKEAQHRRDGAVAVCKECEVAAAQANATLEGLVASAGLAAGTDLQELIGGLNGKAALQEELRQQRARLVEQGDGHDEQRLRAELATFDADRVEADLALLAQEDDELDREGKEVYAARDHDARERQKLESGTGAELAAQQRSMAETALLASAHDWKVLKLGALLLGSAIERRRAEQQDPLMRRAGELFATLTGGSFAGFAQDYDDSDTPHLVGRRGGGGTVRIEEMSEGTRDQFYLALRLAYLEDFAVRAEPAPFVADDLFSTSDPVRTGHGLAALAAIGDRIQPIVFTHHPHVADIARARLGAAVDVLELGAC